MNEFWSTLTTVIVGIIGLATIAVVLSPKAQTAQVIGAGSGGLSELISSAVAPVTGTGYAGSFLHG